MVFFILNQMTIKGKPKQPYFGFGRKRLARAIFPIIDQLPLQKITTPVFNFH